MQRGDGNAASSRVMKRFKTSDPNGLPYTPRTYQDINADIVNSTNEVTEMIGRLRRQGTNRTLPVSETESHEDAAGGGFRKRKVESYGDEHDGDVVIVGGRQMREQDINDCRNPEMRVEARIMFSRHQKSAPDLLKIPLCDTSTNLLTRIDTNKLRSQCHALNQFGRSDFTEVRASFLRQKKGAAKSLPQSKSAASIVDVAADLLPSLALPKATKFQSMARAASKMQQNADQLEREKEAEVLPDIVPRKINYIRRNKSEKALKQLVPEYRARHFQELAYHREELAADVYCRRVEMHHDIQHRSLEHFGHNIGSGSRNTKAVQEGADWRTTLNVILWVAKLKSVLGQSFEARRRYAVERQWMLPVRVWRWCRKTRRRAAVSRRWSYVWKFVRVLRQLYRIRNRHRAADKIRSFIDNFVWGQELKKGLRVFRTKIVCIQRYYTSFNNYMMARLHVINNMFIREELRYLFLVFSSCASYDIQTVDEGKYLGEEGRKSPPKIQRTSTKKKLAVPQPKRSKDAPQEVPKLLSPRDDLIIPKHVQEKLRGTVERYRLRERVRTRILRREVIRRLRVSAVLRNRFADAIQLHSHHIKEWVKFAQVFNILDDEGVSPAAFGGATQVVDRKANHCGFTPIDMFDWVKAAHSVFGVLPDPVRCATLHEELFQPEYPTRSPAQAKHLRDALVVTNLLKDENVTERQLFEAFKEEEPPLEIPKDAPPTLESLEKEMNATPRDIGDCFRKAELTLEKTFRDEEERALVQEGKGEPEK